MKIEITISHGSTIVTANLYPSENSLWIRNGNALVRKPLTEYETEKLRVLLTENPIGKLIEYATDHADIFTKKVITGDW